jgi:hypothetical protein
VPLPPRLINGETRGVVSIRFGQRCASRQHWPAGHAVGETPTNLAEMARPLMSAVDPITDQCDEAQ